MSKMVNQEEELLEEVCRKHGLDSRYLKELISLEKEYADRNMSRRRGIHERISELVTEWVEEEAERRAIL